MNHIQHEKAVEKLKKIKALAERGVGGEKEGAMQINVSKVLQEALMSKLGVSR